MIEAFAILNNEGETVYKVGDNIFSSINDIFHDEEYTDYITLDPVDKYNLIQNIYNNAIDVLYPGNVDIDDVKNAFDKYLDSIGDDALYVNYTNDDHIFIRGRSRFEIESHVLDIVADILEE